MYAWFEVMSTSSTPAFCLLVNDPISLGDQITVRPGGQITMGKSDKYICLPFGATATTPAEACARIYPWKFTAKRSKAAAEGRHADTRTWVELLTRLRRRLLLLKKSEKNKKGNTRRGQRDRDGKHDRGHRKIICQCCQSRVT